jgi:malonate-semialdehyde dehydrogenase (acetylating)/methylmalonate-semialdehyde dehydrogenase
MLALTKFQRYNFTKIYGNFFNGEFVQSKATKFYDIKNPVTQELVAQAPQSTPEEFNQIVANAKEAFKTWSRVPLMSTYLFYRFSQTKIYVRSCCIDQKRY